MTGVQVISGQGIPVLGILIQARAGLPVSAGRLQQTLASWQAQIASVGPFGPGLGMLAAIQEMAQRAGVSVPHVPATFLTPLMTSSAITRSAPG